MGPLSGFRFGAAGNRHHFTPWNGPHHIGPSLVLNRGSDSVPQDRLHQQVTSRLEYHVVRHLQSPVGTSNILASSFLLQKSLPPIFVTEFSPRKPPVCHSRAPSISECFPFIRGSGKPPPQAAPVPSHADNALYLAASSHPFMWFGQIFTS